MFFLAAYSSTIYLYSLFESIFIYFPQLNFDRHNLWKLFTLLGILNMIGMKYVIVTHSGTTDSIKKHIFSISELNHEKKMI